MWHPRSLVLGEGKQTTASHCVRDGETLMGRRGGRGESKERDNTRQKEIRNRSTGDGRVVVHEENTKGKHQ